MRPESPEAHCLSLLSDPFVTLEGVLEAIALTSAMETVSGSVAIKLGIAINNGLAQRLGPNDTAESEKLVIASVDIIGRLKLPPDMRDTITLNAVRGPARNPGPVRDLIVDRWVGGHTVSPTVAFELASLFAGASDASKACEWLRHAMTHPTWGATFPHESCFDGIRATPQFQALIAEAMAKISPDRIFEGAELTSVPDPAVVKRVSFGKSYSLRELPPSIINFTQVSELDLSSNRHLDLANVLSILIQLPKLAVLNMSDCGLTAPRAPASLFARLPGLTKLVLGSDENELHARSNLYTQDEQCAFAAELPHVALTFPPRSDHYDHFNDFGSTKPERATKDIQDPELKLLYWHLEHDAYRALGYALRLAQSHADKLAALQAAGEVLNRFCEELDDLADWKEEELMKEFGEGFGYLKPAEIRARAPQNREAIARLQAAGVTSTVHATYKAAAED